jgi:hypothetical protein
LRLGFRRNFLSVSSSSLRLIFQRNFLSVHVLLYLHRFILSVDRTFLQNPNLDKITRMKIQTENFFGILISTRLPNRKIIFLLKYNLFLSIFIKYAYLIARPGHYWKQVIFHVPTEFLWLQVKMPPTKTPPFFLPQCPHFFQNKSLSKKFFLWFINVFLAVIRFCSNILFLFYYIFINLFIIPPANKVWGVI